MEQGDRSYDARSRSSGGGRRQLMLVSDGRDHSRDIGLFQYHLSSIERVSTVLGLLPVRQPSNGVAGSFKRDAFLHMTLAYRHNGKIGNKTLILLHVALEPER